MSNMTIQGPVHLEITDEDFLRVTNEGRIAPTVPTIVKTDGKMFIVYFEDWFEYCQEKFPIMSLEEIRAFIQRVNETLKETIKQKLQQKGYGVENLTSEIHNEGYYGDYGRTLIVGKIVSNKNMGNIDEKIEVHFSSVTAKPIPISSLFGDKEVKTYSSHGEWSTLGRMRELEEERGNVFPVLPDYLPETPAVWICFTKRLALRYLELAEEWERLMSDAPLTEKDLEYMKEIIEVVLKPSDIIAWTDFDQGYLILRSNSPLEDKSNPEHRLGFVEVRFLMDVPETLGLNGTRTGPFEKNAVHVFPEDTASFYVKRGQAEYVREEATKPTLKELFSGSTLDSYLEAARVRPLFAEEMRKSATEKWFLRSKAETLIKQIKEERGKHGL